MPPSIASETQITTKPTWQLPPLTSTTDEKINNHSALTNHVKAIITHSNIRPYIS